MGTSKERDGLFGKYTEHFDDDGNKVGESKERDGLFGKYIENSDAEGNKTGESREKDGFFGDYTEYSDSSGNKIGESRDREGLFGAYTEHSDSEGKKIGESREREGLFGNYTDHSGGFHPHHKQKHGESRESSSKGDAIESSESAYECSDYGSMTSNSNSASDIASENTMLFLVLGAIAYIGVVWGAWVLMDHVTQFSFVWWLCVLALLAGIPLYIAAAYVAFWLAVAAFVLAIVILLIQYFLQNPY